MENLKLSLLIFCMTVTVYLAPHKVDFLLDGPKQLVILTADLGMSAQ